METIKSSKEKQDAYKREYSRLKKALKEEFYLEGVAISYAIIEDRLVAFLHHAGIVSRKNENLRINQAVYPYIRCLLRKDDKYSVKIKDISVKVSLICKLLTMDEATAMRIDDEVDVKRTTRKSRIVAKGYMLDLCKQVSATIENELIVDIFYELDSWRNERNQLIHALLNKTVLSSEIAKKHCAETGQLLSRTIDNCLVKPFKCSNDLRKKYKIQ